MSGKNVETQLSKTAPFDKVVHPDNPCCQCFAGNPAGICATEVFRAAARMQPGVRRDHHPIGRSLAARYM
jgi:hypothetical protein